MRGKILLIVRRLHLYLSVFFAPLLLVFVVTGWAQTMNFDHASPVLENLSQVHVRQIYEAPPRKSAAPGTWALERSRAIPMKWLVAAMAVALLISISLGLALAFTMVRNRVPVWVALILGIAVPVFLLALAHRR